MANYIYLSDFDVPRHMTGITGRFLFGVTEDNIVRKNTADGNGNDDDGIENLGGADNTCVRNSASGNGDDQLFLCPITVP